MGERMLFTEKRRGGGNFRNVAIAIFLLLVVFVFIMVYTNVLGG